MVVVAGGGHFGSKAAKYAKESGARVAIVDLDPHCAAAAFADSILGGYGKGALDTEGSAVLFVQDAVDFLLDLLRSTTPGYIVPAVPGHLAAWVVERWLKTKGLVVSPSGMVSKVTSAMPQSTILFTDEAKGVVVTSYMPQGQLCRLPCMQPGDRCPTTGRAKLGPMHRFLSEAAAGNADITRVFVSRLVGPEAGCFRGEELASLLVDLGSATPPYTLAVGTSCECHGILNLFAVSNNPIH